MRLNIVYCPQMKMSGQICQKLVAFGCFLRAACVIPPGDFRTISLSSSINCAPVVFVVLLLSGCGRYGTPLPPEAYSPAAVQDLAVTASADGVLLNWTSPDDDRRGKELKELTHFDILRVHADNIAKFLKDPVGESERVGRVIALDRTLLEEKREAAREKKIPLRKVKVDESLTKYSFLDSSILSASELEKPYLYSVVPYGKDGLPGEVLNFPKITFRGELSNVEIISSSDFDRPYILTLRDKNPQDAVQ